MSRPDFAELLAKVKEENLSVIQIIALGLVAGSSILFVVLWKLSSGTGDTALQQVMMLAVGAFSLMILPVSLFLPGKIFRGSAPAGELPPDFFSRYRQAFIIRAAMYTAVAEFSAIALHISGGGREVFVPVFLVCQAMQIYFFPWNHTRVAEQINSLTGG